MKNPPFKTSCNFSFYSETYSSGKTHAPAQTPQFSQLCNVPCWPALEAETWGMAAIQSSVCH